MSVKFNKHCKMYPNFRYVRKIMTESLILQVLILGSTFIY